MIVEPTVDTLDEALLDEFIAMDDEEAEESDEDMDGDMGDDEDEE